MGNVLEGTEADWQRDPRPVDPSRESSAYIQDARDRWKYRRYMIFGAVALLGIVLLALAFFGDGDKFSAAIWAFVSLVALYIGAPVADDFLQTMPRARAA